MTDKIHKYHNRLENNIYSFFKHFDEFVDQNYLFHKRLEHKQDILKAKTSLINAYIEFSTLIHNIINNR